MPEMQEENQRIYELLNLASSQWRAGPSGVYALDYGVIIEMAKAMDIDIDGAFFEKLKAFELTVLSEIQKKRKEVEREGEWQK